MSLNKIFSLDCDRCEAGLTDRAGLFTGSDKCVEAYAGLGGWKYTTMPGSNCLGWHCPTCLSKPTPSAGEKTAASPDREEGR